MVFGRSIIGTLQENFNLLKDFTVVSEIITRLIFIFITFVLFLILYKFLPGYKLTFRSQIWGAFFASIALNIISFLASFISVFRYTITYGSLTILFTTMIWVYFAFYIIFLGAEINKYISIKKIN